MKAAAAAAQSSAPPYSYSHDPHGSSSSGGYNRANARASAGSYGGDTAVPRKEIHRAGGFQQLHGGGVFASSGISHGAVPASATEAVSA